MFSLCEINNVAPFLISNRIWGKRKQKGIKGFTSQWNNTHIPLHSNLFQKLVRSFYPAVNLHKQHSRSLSHCNWKWLQGISRFKIAEEFTFHRLEWKKESVMPTLSRLERQKGISDIPFSTFWAREKLCSQRKIHAARGSRRGGISEKEWNYSFNPFYRISL